MKGLILVPITIIAFVLAAWVVNFVKLTECDFEAPYKCEAIHGVGIIPPVALGSVWFDSDKK